MSVHNQSDTRLLTTTPARPFALLAGAIAVSALRACPATGGFGLPKPGAIA